MSAPHPAAIDTADPAPLRIFRSAAPDLDEIADRYRANAARRIPITETESEVMPVAEDSTGTRTARVHDTRPASATRADRLAEIATLIRQLTYGEMIELAAAIWKARLPVLKPTSDNPNPQITAESLPGILHRWSR